MILFLTLTLALLMGILELARIVAAFRNSKVATENKEGHSNSSSSSVGSEDEDSSCFLMGQRLLQMERSYHSDHKVGVNARGSICAR
jgi:hypothetical protein